MIEKKQKKISKYFTNTLINRMIFFFVIIFGVFSAFVLVSLEDLQGIKILETYRPPVVTKILDVHGRLVSEFYKERRRIVDYSEISKNITKATISVEDKRFLSHYGVDVVRILKALFVNLSNLRKEQGGSTITIQLSKLIFLDHKKTFERKIKELWYAFQIEKQYSKKEILNFYFNQVNYGHGGYGVEAASQFYFNKAASKLNLEEASLLSGLPNSPYYYSPYRFPKNSQRRHRTVLIAMVNNGMLEPDVASSAYLDFWIKFGKETRSVQETFGQLADNKAPYFTEYIRNKIEKDLDKGIIYEKGIIVHTTLNLDHQQAAQKYLWEQLDVQKKFSKKLSQNLPEKNIQSLFRSLSHHAKVIGVSKVDFERNVIRKKLENSLNKMVPSLEHLSWIAGITPPTITLDRGKNIERNHQKNPQGAIISLEPATGRITAMVGGSPFNYNNQFNRAMDLKRQVGSVIKPFIYAVAVDKSLIRASTILNDAPKSFDGYIPKNYSQKFRGRVTVRDALRKSVNILAVEVMDMVGVEPMRNGLAGMFSTYTKTHMRERFPKNLTTSLGSGSFSPLSIATAYAVLANDGVEVIPNTIRYITDGNGSIIKNYEVELLGLERRRLIDRSTAFIIRDIIKDVFRPGGTAYNYELLKDFRHWKNSYGKTGTTSNWKDAWFAGANAYLSTVVWFGYDDNKSLGRGRTGGRVAVPVWIRYNSEVLQNRSQEGNSLPNEVVEKQICIDCDGLAGPLCDPKKIRKEYYKIDNYPKTVCKVKKKSEEENKFLGVVKKIKQKSQTDQVSRFMNFVNRFQKRHESNFILNGHQNEDELEE